MRSLAAVVVCSALLGACGDGGSSGGDGGIRDVTDDADADAGQDYCWPAVAQTPHGTAEVGGGDTAFEPMPETIPLFFGIQAGFGVMTRVRMTGFAPGDGGSPPSPDTPYTRLRATFVDKTDALTDPIPCGYRRQYVANSVGSYDSVDSISVGFRTCWGTDVLVGAKIKIDAEVMGPDGSYATGSTVITATEPDPEHRNVPTICGM